MARRYQVHREVARNGYFEGEIALSVLSRLTEYLHPDSVAGKQNKVLLRFEFERNEFDMPVIHGELETCLELECQRCLQALELPMRLGFELMIDASDEMVRDSSLETLYSDDGYIDILALVEDELILGIPLVVMHEDSGCNEFWHASSAGTDNARKSSPFAVLEQLKTTDSK